MSQGEGQGSINPDKSIDYLYLKYKTYIWALVAVLVGVVGIYVGAHFAPEGNTEESSSQIILLHHLPRDLGIAALTLGLLAIIYEFSLRNHFLDDAKDVLKRAMGEENKVLEQLDEVGIKAIYESMPDHMTTKLRQAKTSIRILQTYSGDFLDNNALGNALVEAAETIEIHILLLNPKSMHVSSRSQDIGDGRNVKQRIINDIHNIRELCKKSVAINNRIKVRLYNATPVIALYGYDDTNIIGTFWQGMVANRGPQLEVSSGTGATVAKQRYAISVMSHWQKLWEADPPKTIDAKKTEWWKD